MTISETHLVAGAPWKSTAPVNAVGMVSISGNYHSVGQQFTGRRITLRLEATLGHVIIDGVLTRTIPLHLTRPNAPASLACPAAGPAATRVKRTVSCRGGTQIIGNASESDSATQPDRHHRSRRNHLRVYDQQDQLIKDRRPHQPQGGPSTQGLRSHHQPPNRLGTVTYHRSYNDTHHVEPRHGMPDMHVRSCASDMP
jgi:hypothetical protein